jgi:hypothetical protein
VEENRWTDFRYDYISVVRISKGTELLGHDDGLGHSQKRFPMPTIRRRRDYSLLKVRLKATPRCQRPGVREMKNENVEEK